MQDIKVETKRSRRTRWSRCTALVTALLVLVAGCGGTTDGSSDTSDSNGADATSVPPTTAAAEDGGDSGAEIIRFSFAPDPVWDYLNDTGALAEWEESNNTRIVTSSSWDFFTYFAGGHGDLVSMGTYHMPVLEAQTGIKVVAFGRYNHQRVSLFRRAGDPYETLADVPKDSKICVSEATGNTVVWSVIAGQLHDLDYRVGEGDFDLVIQDHFVMPELLARGECEVAAFIPEAAVPWLRDGDIEQMYEGRQPWQIYQDICECDHEGVMGNLFVANAEWFDAHPDEVASFLELWETGLQLWAENKEEIIGLYPQHFAVESQEDIDFMIEYMSGPNDWFADSVYMDDAWIEEETKFYEYMVEAGWMEADQELPRFESVDKP